MSDTPDGGPSEATSSDEARSGVEAAEDDEQRDEAQHSQNTGGDASAAGSIDEREAVATDEDELFQGD